MQLRVDDLLSVRHAGLALDVNSVDGVSPAALLVEVGSGNCFLGFTFEKQIKSLLLVSYLGDSKVFDVHLSLSIVLD